MPDNALDNLIVSHLLEIKQQLGGIENAISPIPKLQADVSELMKQAAANDAVEAARKRWTVGAATLISACVSFLTWLASHISIFGRMF